MNENQILTEQLEIAPPEIKAFLAEGKWSAITEEVARRNNLINEQPDSFENEVLFVLLGMELMRDFSQNLRLNVGLTENTAEGMAQEVSEKIFKDVEPFLPTEIEDEEVPSEKMEKPVNPTMPEISHNNLPMVEEGEVAHDVPHVDQAAISNPAPAFTSASVPTEPETNKEGIEKPAPTPNPHYPVGNDPYREPLV